MGFIGGLFSGERGAGFRAQQGATTEQAQQLYRQQQERLAQQQAFTQALMAQSPGAIAAQQQVLGQMQERAAGMGPSVAERQLAESTAANVARTGALMAGQRGASSNVGLVGREAARLGAQTQQEAARQAATLRAQEQMAAQQQVAGLAGQQLGQIGAAQQTGIAGTQGAQQNILEAINRQNAVNAAIAQGNQQFQSGLIGGLIGGGAQAMAGGMADGGEVKDDKKKKSMGQEFAEGLSASLEGPAAQTPGYQAGLKAGMGIGKAVSSGVGRLFAPGGEGQTQGGYAGANLGVDKTMPTPINPAVNPAAIGAYKLPFAEGGKVDAMLSPGEKYLSPKEVKKVSDGKKDIMEAGKMVPGKAQVKGDSLKNDTVPAKLEEGGIVIPRSVMQSKDPAEKARKFVAAIVAKQQMKRK